VATIKLTPPELPGRLTSDAHKMRQGFERGLLESMHKAKRTLQRRTPVDRGQMKSAWRINKNITKFSLINDAPYAGIIEAGARPHPVSEEGRESIRLWVSRHFPGQTEQELDGITMAIVHKLRTKGQKPTWFVRDSMDKIVKDMATLVRRAMKRSVK